MWLRSSLVALACLAATSAAADMAISDVKLHTGIGKRPSVAYARLENRNAAPDALIKVESPAFKRIELHTYKHAQDGMMRMRRIKRIALPAGEAVKLRSGGHHLMLFGFRGETGSPVALTFTFADSPPQTINVVPSSRRKKSGHHDHH